MVVEARLRLRHRGCYSESLPAGLQVLHLSGDAATCLCLVQGGDEKQRDATLDAMAASFGSRAEVLERAGDRVLARCHCASRGMVQRAVERGATVLWPVLHAGGWEHLHLVAADAPTMERVLADLRAEGELAVEHLSHSALEGLGDAGWLSSLSQVLSPRQMAALTLAIDEGYYARPRGATLEELARRSGVSRSTYQEHLTKAEEAVMGVFSRLLR